MLKIFFSLFLLCIFSLSAQSENGNPDYGFIPLDEKGKPRALSMKETVKLVLDNNTTVRIQQLEILKSDSDLLKDEAKYAPMLGAGYTANQRINKALPSTAFTGTQLNEDRYYANISKLFSTGTYFQTEYSDYRYDSNVGESISSRGNSFATALAQPPLHTGALTFVLRQEILKNTFGYNYRRLNEIARTNAGIQRENTIYTLSQLVVQAMIDYWNLSISEENLETAELLKKNTENIRGITAQKVGLGLSENFELNQWNALLESARTQVDSAKLDRNTKRRALLRTLNLDPDLELKGITDLETKLPADIDIQKDTETAFRTRPDFQKIVKQRRNAELILEMAENSSLPSVTVGGRYSNRNYGRHMGTAVPALDFNMYPESSFEFKLEYPLWDPAVRADIRNAKINLRQLTIQEEEMKRKVVDELKDGFESIKTSHESLQRAEESLRQTQMYYNGLLFRYRQGRFTAQNVKDSLDALVKSRQALVQAKINFNISIVRYELTRNNIFSKYEVDVDSVIDRMRGE